MTGLVDGEGCFYVKTNKNNTCLTGFQVRISLSVSKHVRDEFLRSKFIDYLGCGTIEKVSTRDAITFVVYKFSDILDKIIPFFPKFLYKE